MHEFTKSVARLRALCRQDICHPLALLACAHEFCPHRGLQHCCPIGAQRVELGIGWCFDPHRMRIYSEHVGPLVAAASATRIGVDSCDGALRFGIKCTVVGRELWLEPDGVSNFFLSRRRTQCGVACTRNRVLAGWFSCGEYCSKLACVVVGFGNWRGVDCTNKITSRFHRISCWSRNIWRSATHSCGRRFWRSRNVHHCWSTVVGLACSQKTKPCGLEKHYSNSHLSEATCRRQRIDRGGHTRVVGKRHTRWPTGSRPCVCNYLALRSFNFV